MFPLFRRLRDEPQPDMADVCVFRYTGKRNVCDKADDAANPGGEGEGDGDDYYAY